MRNSYQLGDGPVPRFGENGFHSMRDADANVLVEGFNSLLALEVVHASTGQSRLEVSKGRTALILNVPESETAEPTTPTSVKRALITSLAGDYLVCDPWDDDAADWSATSIMVAKPTKLRNSIPSEYGFSYSYPDTNTRVATASGYDAQTYSVDRPYTVGDELYVFNTGETTGVGLATYIDLNVDARAWIAIPVIPIP